MKASRFERALHALVSLALIGLVGDELIRRSGKARSPGSYKTGFQAGYRSGYEAGYQHPNAQARRGF